MLRLILSGTCFLALAACATGRDGQPSATAASVPGPTCLQTGQRVSGSPGSCVVGAHGRAYSRDDLERTGQTDVAQALQQLDPSITVHH
jgi:hypothetical protein